MQDPRQVITTQAHVSKNCLKASIDNLLWGLNFPCTPSPKKKLGQNESRQWALNKQNRMRLLLSCADEGIQILLKQDIALLIFNAECGRRVKWRKEKAEGQRWGVRGCHVDKQTEHSEFWVVGNCDNPNTFLDKLMECLNLCLNVSKLLQNISKIYLTSQ